MLSDTSIVVIGVGNLMRGDDAIGLLALRALAKISLSEIRLVEIDGEATQLLEAVTGASGAIVIDACRSGSPAGTIHRFDVAVSPIPTNLGTFSSHGFGLAAGLELARSLEQLPRACIVFAVEVEEFTRGAALTPEVSSRFNELLATILNEIKRLRQETAS